MASVKSFNTDPLSCGRQPREIDLAFSPRSPMLVFVDAPTKLNPLPLDHAWNEIRDALSSHRNLVLVAEPGAGKSTRFPPLLASSGLLVNSKRIVMLEPRRLAARASAQRMADEQGWQLGQEVGYQVRFENRTSAATRIEVLTEGLLTRKLLSDPELTHVGAVILDEFHERSQHTDLALGLLFELQQLSRPDLKIIVMSATIDAEKVARYLDDCPVVRVPGRNFPVDIFHGKKPLSLDTGPSFVDHVSGMIEQVLSGHLPRSGDVLVFLPGTREIRSVRERIATLVARVDGLCFELHGSLSLDEQDQAIRRVPGKTKVILATNIAETSLTIDGVGTVIDSGLQRTIRLDSAGFERLVLSRISLASATQRAGRAGRQSAGHCYRLWSKLDDNSMPPFEAPELTRTDLTDAVLSLLAQGVTDAQAFSWLEPPPREAIAFAERTLTDLGFRDPTTGSLTPIGREALKLPVSARIAKLLLEAIKCDRLRLGATLAALLSEKDIAPRGADLKRCAQRESDLVLRLHLLSDDHGVDRFSRRQIDRVSEHFIAAGRRIDRQALGPPAFKGPFEDEEWAERLLLLAFADRLCRRRRPGERAARMVGGRGVILSPHSTVESAPLFVALASSEPSAPAGSSARPDAQVSLASPVDRAWLEHAFSSALSKRTEVVFDNDSLCVQKQSALFFRDLPLEQPFVARPDSDEAFPVLLAAAKERWSTHLATRPEVQRWLARVSFFRQLTKDDAQGEMIGDEIINTAIQAALEEAVFGETRLQVVMEKSLPTLLERHLPRDMARALLEAAPDTIAVPSGSRIPIQYPEGRPPFLEVRIQEIFGWTTSPRIGFGQCGIVLHLLGPNFRPVQVTSDLKSFWHNGYSEVRKELRARYPKHSWPEDPLTAKAEAKGRRRS